MKNKFTGKLTNHAYNPLNKILVVWSGFWYIMQNDVSVTYKVLISLVTLILGFFYRQAVDVVIIVLATGFMLSLEIMNSVVELICDFMETNYNPKIKLIKDVAATAAGISILTWVVVIVYEITSLVFK